MSYQFNDQINNQFSAYTQQFTAAAARVNRLALENAESVFGVQLRTLEKNFEATTGFLGELADARDLEAYKALLPKGLQVARDNAERAAAANQEVFGLNLKTSEALGQLTKSQFEAATEQAQATVAKATKAIRRIRPRRLLRLRGAAVMRGAPCGRPTGRKPLRRE